MLWRHPLGTASIADDKKYNLSLNFTLHSTHSVFVRVMSLPSLCCLCLTDPFAAVFGSESFGGGFADFSALTKVIVRMCCTDFVLCYSTQ